MTEEELRLRWEAESPLYEEWGRHVINCIKEKLEAISHPRSLDEVIKIPPYPRIKTTSSLIDKSLYRKRYENPYEDVEDKVGVRFVVLLTQDIRLVEQAIRSCGFTTSKDRDFEADKKSKPLEFAYQSDHFVVRAAAEIVTEGRTFPRGIPCEVQVRTLLQHAHGELTHGRVYKGEAETPALVKRTVAKSMMLVEVADDFFSAVVTALEEHEQPTKELLDFLTSTYENEFQNIQRDRAKSNVGIIQALHPVLGAKVIGDIKDLLDSKPFLIGKISDRAQLGHLFRQPAILLAYLGAATKPHETKRAWPLTIEELRPIFTDLGKNLDDF